MQEKSGRERVLVLVKALPHAGKLHGETVCCAGVTSDLQWRRQYPIHFRRLSDKQFKRWQWIDYDWVLPRDDRRPESRRVQEEMIIPGNQLARAERARFLEPLIVGSTDEAKAKGQTLALLRPRSPRFHWKRKTATEIAHERAAYKAAASQLSFMDKELEALEPCPYAFKFDYETADGVKHRATCDDWETSAMFYRFEKEFGVAGALTRMERTFNEEYPKKGMAFALGTHSRRPDQWLLVGVLRLDPISQLSLNV
jgi:hypothetical protein